jgi:hypothetical protein
LKQEKKKCSLYFIPQKVLKGFKIGLDKDAKANGYRVVLAGPQRNPFVVFRSDAYFHVYFNGLYSNQTILKRILYQELSLR